MLGITSLVLVLTLTEHAPLQELETGRSLCLQLLQALCNQRTTPSQNTRLVAQENVSAAGTKELQNRWQKCRRRQEWYPEEQLPSSLH